MCLSPHEMTTAQVEEVIGWYSKDITDLEAELAKAANMPPGTRRDEAVRNLERAIRRTRAALENYEALLKERAEAGTL